MSALPFDPDALSAEERILYDAMVAKRRQQGVPFDGPYAALMNHPELCQRIENLGFFLKFEGRLPRDIYQFTVLAVAHHTDAAFEWTDHIGPARAAGVPAEILATLETEGVLRGVFPAPYELPAQVLAATLAWKNIPVEIQSTAIAAYGKQGFVELVVLSGFYQMFSAINQGFDVQPPPDPKKREN
jgi:4-carboxymuconolactone decarboxylase